jgi:hypothetical protein
MFASQLREILAQEGRCILECDPRLLALFRRSFPRLTVFGSPPGGGLAPGVAPRPVDVMIEGGSLARLLRRAPADFPQHSGYLAADPDAVARWRERLVRLGPGLKVGISWQGGVRKTRQALRSIPLERLLPVLRAPDVRFVSLQYTADARNELAELRARHGVAIEHWQEGIDDYDQTAALVCGLDLVISVCTSLVHLTGALGKPVWVMTPLSPEWRYGIAGDSIPWYPSARLFRQDQYRKWDSVIERVAAALRARSAA